MATLQSDDHAHAASAGVCWPVVKRPILTDMAYQVLADVTMTVHFAFLAYVVAGGFAAWRWPRTIWPHLLAAGWGLSIVAFHLHCPLTWLEDWARRRAGGSGLDDGFIETYLTGVVYPQRYVGLLRLLAAMAIAVSWAGALRSRRRHPRSEISTRM